MNKNDKLPLKDTYQLMLNIKGINFLFDFIVKNVFNRKCYKVKF